MPRTNNSVESWHGTITAAEQSHLTLNKCVHLFKLEQSNTENLTAALLSGTVMKRKNKDQQKDDRIRATLETYKVSKKY